MTSYTSTAGPSRTSRITLPPMMVMLPSAHHRPLDYEHQLPPSAYLRHAYMNPAEFEYECQYDRQLSFRVEEDDHLRAGPSDAADVAPHEPTHGGAQPLSLSLLIAAANAAQDDPNAYLSPSPINFPPPLPLDCQLRPAPTYGAPSASPSAAGNWPVGLTHSESDRLPPSPSHTLDTPELVYEPGMMTCCSPHSEVHHPHDAKLAIDRFDSEPIYDHRPSHPTPSNVNYHSHHINRSQHHEHVQHYQASQQLAALPAECVLKGVDDWETGLNLGAKRNTKKRPSDEPEGVQQGFEMKQKDQPTTGKEWKVGKPKQGRKKRSAGYVRPIIIHRKRVGQRLLDMLKNAPVPSKAPAMELRKARCFPFADMKNKLREWYGLQIDWPEDAAFQVDELRSTRRMRLDELERLDRTLDGGSVRLRLCDEVLTDEPHRFNEFSFPSDGYTTEDHSSELERCDSFDRPYDEHRETISNKRRRES